jgi:8-amino-7-oxononanoate synthase
MHKTPAPIAIVGVGCRFPQADDAAAYWKNIEEARACFTDIPRDRWDHRAYFSPNQRDLDKAWTSRGGFIEGYKKFPALHFGIAPRRLEVMDPQQRLLIEATRVALMDAGYETRTFDRTRTGVFLGVSVAEFKNIALARVSAMQIAAGEFGPAAATQELRDALMEMTERVVPTRAFSLSGALTALAATSISQVFDFGGPSYTIDAACASASVAINDAVLQLRTGLIDSAVAGGAYINLTPDNLISFTRIGAISPTGACRPFDVKADGFVQGDGVGVVYLKRLDDALRDGDRIHALIQGTGANNDGRGEGPMTPRVEGQMRALRAAYENAGFSPATVAFFEAHGTATNVGDPAEIEALGTALRDAKVDSPALIGSVKGVIGHAMSAAGIAGLIKAVKMIENRVAPAQPNFTKANPSLKLEKFPLEVSAQKKELLARAGAPLRVAISSFGFGGTNSHIVLEEPPEPKVRRRRAQAAPAKLADAVVVSAPNAALLAAHLGELSRSLEGGVALEDFVFTLNARRKRERLRAVLGARSVAEFVENAKRAQGALAGMSLPPEGKLAPVSIGPQVAVFDFGPADSTAPKIAFLFPGQGAQRLRLFEEIRAQMPKFAETLAGFSAATRGVLEKSLEDYIYPAAHADRADAEKELTRTEVCQPAMAALGLSLAAVLGDAGVHADISLGHSLGEFAALANAGALDAAEVLRLVALRGRAMNALGLPDPGTMAAVLAPADAVRAEIAGIEGVWLANINHPRQVSISGTFRGVAEASAKLSTRGFEVRPLTVSHAFHTPVLAGIRAEMARALDEIKYSAPTHPVYSCVAPENYSADAARARDILLGHATAPVDFVRALEAARAAGASVFVHLGAGSLLGGFAKATLNDVVVVNIGDEPMRGLATLSALGVPVDFDAVYRAADRVLVDLPETPLEREEYWPIKEAKQPRPKVDHPLPAAGVRLEGKTVAKDNEPGLVELFRAQAEILAKHAEIIAEQNRVLAGGARVAMATSTAVPSVTVPSNSASPSVTERVQAVLAEPAPVAAVPASATAAAASELPVRDKVFEIVARISAFPRESLRGEQRLVDELGFDSLMVADLGGAIQNTFPAIGGLPQSLFSMQTTVADIADHVKKASSKAPVAAAAAVEKKLSPASRYRVVARARGRRALEIVDLAGQTWVVVDRDAALAVALEKRGARVVRVQLTKNGVSANDRLATGTLNLWPESFADGLTGALERSGIRADGIACVRVDVERLHALLANFEAKNICVITGLGGKLGLERSAALEANRLEAGALGYAKSLARERPQSFVRAMDIDPAAPLEANAEAIVAEIIGGDLASEVGLSGNERFVSELELVSEGAPVREVRSSDVVLITGGTGEIGALVAEAVAQKKPRKIFLNGTRAADEKIAGLLAKLKTYGVEAVYLASDAALLPALPDVTIAFHAAGRIEDASAKKKSAESFARVLRPKVLGFDAILRSCPALTDLVLFSSWAGHFGNSGQTDYSAANEILDRAAIGGPAKIRILSLAFPPWSNTAMVRSIPAVIREAMKVEGVTFLEDAEGLDIIWSAFNSGARGVEVIGRDLPAREIRAAHTEKFSEERHPYLRDHRLAERMVVPLASATDLIVHVAGDFDRPVVIEDLELVRGLFGGESALVRATGKGEQLAVEIRAEDEKVAYRASVKFGEAKITALSLAGESEVLPLSLDDFYREHTFHGPMLRGIERIEKMTADGMVGIIRPSSSSEWMPRNTRTKWAVDPLMVDGAFQLAAYWAEVHLGKAGYPLGFARLSMLRPFGGEPLRATLVLKTAGADGFEGNIYWCELSGEPVALLEGVRGRFAEGVKRKVANGNGAKTNGHSAAVDVPVETYDISQFPELEQLDQRFQMAELMGLQNPYFHMHSGTARNKSIVDGVEMLNYSSYNYLGFSGHPEVVAAAKEAIDKYGTSVSASRVASGERPIHRELEEGVAAHVGVEDSVVFVSGHATNVTTIGHMLDREDLILHDALIHDSILQGIYLSGATRKPFPHNDLDALERTLSQVRKNYRRVLITAEGIYSMDGDTCDLPRLIKLKKKYRALLMIDEAHSNGVLGPAGRGVAHHFPGVNPNDVDIWMGTLSKSFASCGGYIAGSKALVRYLKYTAPGFIYSAGITPPNAAAALKSLELMHRMPEVVERLRSRSKYFLDLARSRGINTGDAIGAAVVPAIIGNSILCMKLSAALAARKINVQPMIYPGVEDDKARLRFFLSATHTEEELRYTVEVLAEELDKLRREESASASVSI